MEAVGTEPTVWFGTQEGCIYVHSAETDWRRCQGKVQLKDAIHCIVHIQGRVAAALGDGSVAIFHRNMARNWDLHSPRLVDLGRPRRSIRCALPVLDRLWCGYGNRIYVLDPRTARILVTSHPESQVRHMAAAGNGIWVSIRLESALRLLHAETGQPLQEAVAHRTLGAFGKRLWVGTSGGTIISLPFISGEPACISKRVRSATPTPVSSTGNSEVSLNNDIPYCAMEQAQISYHGHRDAVRFFLSVPGNQQRRPDVMLLFLSVLGVWAWDGRSQLAQMCKIFSDRLLAYYFVIFPYSGDDTDERYGDLLLPNPRLRRAERSHLIVWQVQA
uniref:Uncharacterized protein n=1 Tax=Salvator merianae TaxID=96440 RepID=A0A8D0B692_SALMN